MINDFMLASPKKSREIIFVVSRYAEVSRAVPFEKLSPNYRRGIETLFTQFTVVMRSRDDLSRLLNAADYQSLTDEGRHCSARANVRFGSKADMCSALAYVRFGPKADIAT